MTRAALGLPGFSHGVLIRELREVKNGIKIQQPVYWSPKEEPTLFLHTHFQAPPTTRAATEPSGCSPDVSQRELRELERGFSEIELLCS
jgi:hypothetical protein